MNAFRTSVTSLLAATILLTAAGAATAAPPGTSTSPSNFNYEDLFYDFELYAATPSYAWQIHWQLSNGETHITGNFSSMTDAYDFAEGLIEYHLEPQNSTGYKVVLVELEPDYELFWTFDTRADALLFEQALQNIGQYTQIRRVSIFANQMGR